MIIAIDETGSFAANSDERQFFIAVHLRQRRTLYKIKQNQFTEWESSLPRSLKNSKGEIKSSLLTDEQLFIFAKKIICSHPNVRITPLAIKPKDNPDTVIDKCRALALIGINAGTEECHALGRNKNANTYRELGNWLKKLNYAQLLKIIVLGECISAALINTVGHSIVGGYDNELTYLRYLIDRDFVKEPRHNAFWHELLRNQLYQISKRTPLPIVDKWLEKGHPFLDKYMENGHLNLNELFWKRLEFVPSHDYFEIRIADATNTIVSRFINQHRCASAYKLIKPLFCKDKRIPQFVINDFDLESYHYDSKDNPWLNIQEDLSLEG